MTTPTPINPPPKVPIEPPPKIPIDPPPKIPIITPKSFTITGTLYQVNGSVAPNATIQAFDVDLRTQTSLGQAKTGADGRYSITYTSAQFRRPGKSLADVKVTAVGATPGSTDAQSAIYWQAADGSVIDLVLGGDKVLGKDEFDNLVDSITPSLDGINIADLTADDVTYLAGETGVSATQLTQLQEAYAASAKIAVPPKFLYGMFREGISTDVTTMLQTRLALLQGGITAAVDDNIIAATDAEVTDALAKLQTAMVNSAAAATAVTSKTGLVFKKVMANPAPIMDSLAKSQDTAAFWADLKTRPETKDIIPNIQFNMQLGIITLNHQPLIDKITAKQTTGEIKSFTDLAKYRASDWLSMIGDPTTIPPEIPGNSAAERAQTYATAISHVVEDAIPTEFVKNRLSDADDKMPFVGDNGKPDVLTFLKGNPTFDITIHRMADFVAQNPTSLTGVKDKDKLFSNMATFQRLYSIAPKFNQVQPLLADGIVSAFQISRMGRTAFSAKYGAALGSPRVAEQIHYRANYVHSQAFTYFANYGSGSSKAPMPVLTNPGHRLHHNPPKGIPDWASLFGTIDSCSCSQCRALDSPAAYLVDLLHFLKERTLGIPSNAKNVLFERRPDLGEIELTCANTNTPVPYVDLSVEILENAISPPAAFATFNLPFSAVALLDKQDAAGLAPFFKPPLSQYANITIEQTSLRWKVNEPSFSYSLASTGSAVIVNNRTRQTSGTAQELAANPQYINMDAYGKLQQQVFPGNLPYNLPWDTVRTYLNHLGVDRYNLLKSFQGMSEQASLQDYNIAIEYLGISSASADIITGKTTSQVGSPQVGPWNLWGFRKFNLDTASAIADPSNRTALITAGLWTTVLTSRVDVFLQQSGIAYSDLLNILQVYSIFRLSVAPTIVAAPNAPVDTCQLDQLTITGLVDVTLGYIIRYIRLWKGLSGWSILDLARAIRVLTTTSPPFQVTSDFLVRLAQVDRLSHHLNLPFDTVLSFYGALETTVYVDHNVAESSSVVKSAYDNIFNNNTVAGQPQLKFTGALTKLPGALTDFAPAIIAGLNISSSDMGLLLSNPNVITSTDVTVANLSTLYRHVTLANALSLSVGDYLGLFKFLSISPFSTPLDTITFSRRAQEIIASNFSLEEMNYLLRYSFVPGSLVAPDDTTIGGILDGLRSRLQKVTVDNTLNVSSVDKNGDLVKAKLSFLSWDPQVITQFMGILSNTASFQVQLASRPTDDIIFPKASDPAHAISADLQGKMTYDPSSLLLSFRGVMTAEEKTALLDPLANLPAPVTAQVQPIFDAPRTFLARNVQSFSIPDYSTALASLPQGITLPIKSKVYFDPFAGLIHSKGALSTAERDSLVALATNLPAQQPFADAIQKLYDLPSSFSPAANDTFLTANDFSSLFDHTTDSGGNPITPTSKFIIVLQKLLPYLLNTLSDQAVTQTLVENLGIDSQSTNFILDNGASTLRRSIFRDPSFVSSSISTRSVFPDQYRGYELLNKISMIITRLNLTFKQLKWVITYRSVAGDPTSAWLDLMSLPLQLVDDARNTFTAWERLYSLTLLRDAIPGGENTLDGIFSAARAPGATADTILKPLVDMKKYSADDLTFLTGPNGLNFKAPDDFKDEVKLTLLLKCLQQTRIIGSSASDAKSLAQTNIDFNTARVAVQITKSRYDLDTWNSVARPLRNLLRENQRAALVSYLLTNQSASGQFWRDTNDLFSYFLIDVEMGPCQLTSRIKQAICSVQLFAQRCLMNLEQEVKADSNADPVWDEWSWMKYENVHAANYQILMNPENYMEPELRDDQTDFFKTFTKELQQADITDDTASAAFSTYLQSLDEISRLEVVSTFHEEEALVTTGNPSVGVLHVIGRTRFSRPVYYYRQWVDNSYWKGGWTKISADVEGDHIMPVVWNKKLFIFWITFLKKQESNDIKMPDAGHSVEHNDPYLDITLAWSILEGSTFTGKKISRNTFPYQADIPDESNIMLNCYVDKDGGKLQVQLRRVRFVAYFTFTGVNGEPTVQTANAGTAPVIQMTQQVRLAATTGTFQSKLVSGKPKRPPRPTPPPKKPPKRPPTPSPPNQPKPTPAPVVKTHPKGPKLPIPPNTDIYNMCFQETDSSDGSVILVGPFGDQVVLKQSPGSKFNLVYTSQDPHLKSESPVFFQHDQRSFFVVPLDFSFKVRYLATAEKVDPTWMNGQVIGQYINNLVPTIPKQDQPYPDPSQAGPSKFAQSIAWEQGEDISKLVEDTSPSVPLLFKPRPIGVSTVFKPSAEIINQNRLPMPPVTVSIRIWTFYLFYHPFVQNFVSTLNREGIDGLLQRSTQLLGENSPTFAAKYVPNTTAVSTDSTGMYPEEVVDFNNGAYSVYNWELFFHIPLLIATKLSQNQRFEEAQKWFHYIFDPTDTSSLSAPKRFWRTKKFFETTSTEYQEQTLPAIFDVLAAKGDPNAFAKLTPDQKTELTQWETMVDEWRKNPFNPWLVARTRTTAFQKMVVMKYLDNLIAWGDSLFRGDTIEKINEATQIYILASEILGRRPVEIPAKVKPEVQSFNSLEGKLDDVSNALVQIEELAPPPRHSPIYRRRPPPTPVRPSVLFFCLPKNDQLLAYWDTVQDRLFKIRHCMNLQGIVRELPLFDPPIDPMLLVKAAAAGVDVSTALSDIAAPLPFYRFKVIFQTAVEVVSELRSLGGAMLSAIEKQDAEGIALLRSSNEITINDMVKVAKEKAIEEANNNLTASQAGKAVVQDRLDHYNSLPFMNEWEITSMGLESGILLGLAIEAAALALAGGIFMIPDIKIGTPTTIGATLGGGSFGSAAQAFAGVMRNSTTLIKQSSTMASTLASYNRRQDDWNLQKTQAAAELKQFDAQIAAAGVRMAIAQQDLKTHLRTIENTKKVDDYMRNKFNNQDLYSWSIGQLSNLYFQTYQTAYDISKRAERAYCNELGLDSASFIQFGYWDSLKKGLLAGDKLFQDLKRMELSYQELDVREYEISTSISLAQLDPLALIQLRENGDAYFTIPEAFFDMIYPGHYMRRLKTVSLTIPCVVGPYTNVNATLSLLKASVRTSSLLSGSTYARTSANDIRFTDSYGQLQSMVTSTGQNDSGLFETNLRDDRLLPFERCGAISSWRIQLPTAFKQFDYRAMSDVVIQLRYTAREGGDILREAVQKELKASILSSIALAEAQNGLARMFSLRHEASAFYKFFSNQTADGTGGIDMDFSNNRFPFVFKDASITINKVQMFVFVNPKYKDKYNETTMQFWLDVAPPAGSQPAPPTTPAPTPPQPFTLTPWMEGFRTSKDFKKPSGTWQLKGNLVNGGKMVADAVQDILFVCYYSTKWA